MITRQPHTLKFAYNRNTHEGTAHKLCNDMKASQLARTVKVTAVTVKSPTYSKPTATIHPEIKLRGKWLQAAGFIPNERVNVVIEQGQLIITPAQ